jgi:hypothetical protein
MPPHPIVCLFREITKEDIHICNPSTTLVKKTVLETLLDLNRYFGDGFVKSHIVNKCISVSV